jgi:predicted GNAT family N-acyltransferase
VIEVRRISAQETWPLRQSVLRPGKPDSEAIFAGDETETTTHWGAFVEDGELVSIASLYRVSMPDPSGENPKRSAKVGYQLRGMASAPDSRGQGFGSAVLEACIAYLRVHSPGAVLWCNAREMAAPFYSRYGFSRDGELFNIPTVGPHYLMWRQL